MQSLSNWSLCTLFTCLIASLVMPISSYSSCILNQYMKAEESCTLYLWLIVETGRHLELVLYTESVLVYRIEMLFETLM